MTVSEVTKITPEAFRGFMGRFATGVTVITSRDGEEPVGTTASAFSSLSLDPPMLLVCLNRESHTGQVVHRTGKFAVNILGEDAPDLAMRFARKGNTKFDGVDWAYGPSGVPLLGGAMVSIECTVTEETQGGTHTVFIASADAGAIQEGPPLAYFAGRFGRFLSETDTDAVQKIQNWIIRNDHSQGSVIDVDELADELELPRSVVFHALSDLRRQAILYLDEDGRFRVATLSMEMLSQALGARRVLELGVVQDTWGTLSERQFEELRVAAEWRNPDADSTPREFAETTTNFHRSLIALAGNAALAGTYQQFNLTASLVRLQQEVGDHMLSELQARDEHLALIDAMQRNDWLAAVAAINDHAEHSLAGARALIDGHSGSE